MSERAVGQGPSLSEGVAFVLRLGGEPVWKVRWGGRVCSPEWQERGPAEAYLSALRNGTRKPEYHTPGQREAGTAK